MKVRYGIIVILSLLAFSTRLLPMAISPYPFNNDAILECRIAQDILSSGSLTYPADASYIDSHSVITPAYNSLLAYVSALTGYRPFDSAQVVVAIVAITTILGVYLISLLICRNLAGAVASTLVVSLFGTFVFLTGSAWKEALGVALLVMLAYAYARRADNRMFAVEVVILGTLPLVHHLVAFIAYLSIAYLTIWSLIFALMNSGVKKRHVLDMTVLCVMGVSAYAYYSANSLGRLSYMDTLQDVLLIVLPFTAFLTVTILFLTRRSHIRATFAPVMATTVFVAFVWNYLDPIFSYEPGFSENVLIMGAVTSALLGVAWYGLEMTMENNSRYRAIPMGFLLPVLTMFAFAICGGLDLSSHKIFYRTFDFADISIAIGIAVAVGSISHRPRARTVVTIVLIFLLVVSFPFAYLTNELVGVRHDTQDYEVDALIWANDSSGGAFSVRSDERIAYTARALYDFGKSPYLPSMLMSGTLSSSSVLNMYEEEWSTIGVNDYPRGHPVVDASYVAYVLDGSNVFYVGGPSENNLIIYQTGIVGATVAFA